MLVYIIQTGKNEHKNNCALNMFSFIYSVLAGMDRETYLVGFCISLIPLPPNSENEGPAELIFLRTLEV